jgi:hypothetical protein
MSSFSFNFVEDEDLEEQRHPQSSSSNGNPVTMSLSTALELEINIVKDVPLPETIIISDGKVSYLPISICDVEFKKCNQHFHSDIDKELDIISGQYEGGYKSWECCFDLVEYMMNSDFNAGSNCNIGTALELGCGVAFPGIYAMKLGYKSVVFSDLNEEVLTDLTWPNIYLNCSSLLDATNCSVKCFSGDWLRLSTYLNSIQQSKFDLILSSETIYSLISCEKLYYMLDKHLADDGVALIATKRFYFGVGGGTFELERMVKESQTLSLQVVKSFEDGQSNIRDILSVTRIKR